MTQLRKMMLEELQRRNYSNGTIRHHLRVVQEFARHFATAPDKLGLNELRSYQAYLLRTRKLAVSTIVNHVSALRFFFVRMIPVKKFVRRNPAAQWGWTRGADAVFPGWTEKARGDDGFWT